MHFERVTYKNLNMVTWDVGGRGRIRPLWRHYFYGAHALIFVVDSNDRERASEAADELRRLLTENELRDAVLLVWANKQDLPNAMSVAELSDKLDLNHIKTHKWFVQSSCATSGDGLYEGLEWLSSAIGDRMLTETAPKPTSAPPTRSFFGKLFNDKKQQPAYSFVGDSDPQAFLEQVRLLDKQLCEHWDHLAM